MEYRVLGPIEAISGGETLEISGKQRSLLALLLIEANRVVSTDRIIDELWGESGLDRQNAMWVVISRLRGQLDPDRPKRTDGTVLVTRPPGYMLTVEPGSIDSHRFEALAAEGRLLIDADPAAASVVLSEALALWRGRAFEEFTYSEFAGAEISRLEELRLATVEDRIEADIGAGRCRAVVSELEALVRQHPARERLTRHLMVSLHLSGRQAESLRAYADHRNYLAEELGLDPSPALTYFESRIVLNDPTLGLDGDAGSDSGVGSGLTIRGYELREPIGMGTNSQVFNAFQPSVGREVAIKILRSEVANDPAFIRRFESEARVLAGLEHPRIVPIYDFWRDPDGAFLVMRRFDGRTLRDLLDNSELAADQSLGIIEQVAGALAAAHDRGISHGDLRPSNILIDASGDPYLSDFGMSLDLRATVPDETGFLAPEQADTGPSIAADVYSLGALASVLIGVDDHPAIASVIDRSRSIDPADRYADARSFLRAQSLATGGSVENESVSTEQENPFRGLHAFHEDDAGVFFGRERLVERLLARLGANGAKGRFVALVGPSGSGKSSVIRAGLVPTLRQDAITGSSHWFIATFTPGPDPYAALAEALRPTAVRSPNDLAERLRVDGFGSAVASVLPDTDAQLLLIIDQMEELFVQAAPDDVQSFLVGLTEAVADRHSKIKIVATLRADFYDAPLRHPQFGELVRLGTEVITPLNAAELQRAITGPAERVGVTVEPGVVAAIAGDMVGQPTALPLLQFALTELYESRLGNAITVDDYEGLGGLATALAIRADAVLDDLDPDQRTDARQVLLSLVTVTEGSADTRRKALLTELVSAASGNLSPVLDTFVKRRLLSVDRDPITRSPTVEIAHEALLTEWSTLKGWIDDARDTLGLRKRLSSVAGEWRDNGRSVDFLLAGEQLALYSSWVDNSPMRLTSLERSFLLSSKDRSAVELETEQRQVRRLRRLVGAVGVAFVVALSAAGVARWQQNNAADARDIAQVREAEAEEQRGIALAQTLVAEQQTIAAEAATQAAVVERMRAQAVSEVGTNPPLAALLAVEAYNIDSSPLSAGSIQQVLAEVDGRQATLFDTISDYGANTVLSADGTLLAAGSAQYIDVWNIDERALVTRIDNALVPFDMNAAGTLVAAHRPDSNEIHLIDTGSGDVVGAVDRDVCNVIRFSPDGGQLALLVGEGESDFECAESTIRRLEIWDISSLKEPVMTHSESGGNEWELWWTPDGAAYLSANPDGVVQLRDSISHEPIWTHQFDLGAGITQGGRAHPIGSLFTTDGSSVVVGVQFNDTSEILLFTFDVASGEITREPTFTAGLGSMNWWNGDETQVVGTLWPSGATVLDLERAGEVLPPPIENPNATSVRIDRDRGRVVVSSFVGIEIFSLDGTSVLERRIPLTAEQLEVKALAGGQTFGSMTQDGTRLLVATLDFQARAPVVQWDLTSQPATVIGELPSAIPAPQGESTMMLDFEGTWILDSDHEQIGPKTSGEFERGLPFIWRSSADGSRYAALRDGSELIDVYDTLSGERIHELGYPGGEPVGRVFPVSEYSFSADGTYMVATFIDSNGAVWGLYNTDTGELVDSGPSGVAAPWIAGTTFYATVPGSFDLERRSIETMEIVGPPLVGHTLILNAIEDDLDSDMIVTQATNGNVRVWDRESGDQIGREIAIGRQAAGTGIAVARDSTLVGVFLDNEFGIWNYDISTWPGLACEVAGRNMTRSEWDDFGPQGEEYRATCPQFPATP